MKRVLHIISSGGWRGGEQQVNALFNSPAGEYEKYLFCPENAELVKRNLSLKEKIFTYKKRLGFDIFAALKLIRDCKKINPNLIHLHDGHAINTFLLADIFGMNIPAVVHRHVNFPVHSKWKYNNQKIKKIICVSDVVKETMKKITGENKLTVIYPGIDLKKFIYSYSYPHKNKLKQELGLSPESKLIGIVSALEKEKNIEEFIANAGKVVEKRKDVSFVIVGDGSWRKKLEAGTKNQGLTQIKFLGFQDDIPEILHSLDLFLFTSKNEGFGVVLLEAMAAKVPVLSSASGGIKNIITDYQNGLFYALENIEDAVGKVELLLSDINLRITLTENAFQYVQQFDVTLMNKQSEQVYNEILEL